MSGSCCDRHRDRIAMIVLSSIKELPLVILPIHLLPDFTGFQKGSGQTGFSQKGRKFLTFIIFVFESAHVATFCRMLSHFAYISPWKLIRGNCATSAVTPFVLTPSGSCQGLPPTLRGGQEHITGNHGEMKLASHPNHPSNWRPPSCPAPKVPDYDGGLPTRSGIRRAQTLCMRLFRDHKDTVYPFFESDTLLLKCLLYCVYLFSDSSNRGMSKQNPLTVLLEYPICIWMMLCVSTSMLYPFLVMSV